MRKRGPAVAGALLVAGLLVAMALEPTRQLFEQRRRVDGMETELDRTLDQNRRLAERIERLKDPDYIEQRAREQIGLVYPGERSYVVMPPGRSELQALRRHRLARRTGAPPGATAESSFVAGFLRFVGFGWLLG